MSPGMSAFQFFACPPRRLKPGGDRGCEGPKLLRLVRPTLNTDLVCENQSSADSHPEISSTETAGAVLWFADGSYNLV